MTTLGQQPPERNRRAVPSPDGVVSLVTRTRKLLPRRVAFCLVTLTMRAGILLRALCALIAVLWPVWADFRSDYRRTDQVLNTFRSVYPDSVRRAVRTTPDDETTPDDAGRSPGQLRH